MKKRSGEEESSMKNVAAKYMKLITLLKTFYSFICSLDWNFIYDKLLLCFSRYSYFFLLLQKSFLLIPVQGTSFTYRFSHTFSSVNVTVRQRNLTGAYKYKFSDSAGSKRTTTANEFYHVSNLSECRIFIIRVKI